MLKLPHNCAHLTQQQSNPQNSPIQASIQYVNQELTDVQAGFRKGSGSRDKISNIHWTIEKARIPEKSVLLLY